MTTFAVVRSASRDHWRDSAVFSRQSFPATGSFDLKAGAFGLLMVHNDDIVSPGEGFDMHFHKDVEIASWIVDGSIRHRDSGSENPAILNKGMAQHISAGSGVRHSEINANGYTSRQNARIVQSWLPDDRSRTTPSHEAHDFNDAVANSGTFVQIAGPNSPLPLGTSGASMWVAHLTKEEATLPGVAFIHLYVISGTVASHSHKLDGGDVLRVANSLTIRSTGRVLVWLMD